MTISYGQRFKGKRTGENEANGNIAINSWSDCLLILYAVVVIVLSIPRYRGAHMRR